MEQELETRKEIQAFLNAIGKGFIVIRIEKSEGEWYAIIGCPLDGDSVMVEGAYWEHRIGTWMSEPEPLGIHVSF